ncbi:succinate dehydrogenase/fumarate reductase iron-sulfur subunit [Candidatus Methylacidithermus pantelleriae]|uniref:Succinate dehydrogenase iron-sulfur subunit n=1 Tax=Candidatus Methylacidithermus pantelleriae TaxID=2744239 RepID=A0A8J2BMP0_9BACT|nr:succinate dehydrogenase/fumarate reductase iron-sulfur subunit [Candidatus Methylacidithermus pantelleriae]CAF0702607.1 Succinate dehydrogenase/fumarate reductase, iron-sulfur subunit [Candidatus Methylacidithermus pantelleriae]
MRFVLRIWRQKDPCSQGRWVTYQVEGVEPDMSFLEMLDQLNENLLRRGEDPVAFESDCREGICGACGLVINGRPHGPRGGIATCQLYMREFRDGQTITIEPWRVTAFPILKDLVVDRSALDRVVQAGGYISVSTGQAPEANTYLVAHEVAERAFDFAHCIGCGACAAACKNGSALLFVGAKLAHLSLLPQGQVERDRRAMGMIEAMEREGFGACSFTRACESVCPKSISVEAIARAHWEYARAKLRKVFGSGT